MSSCRAGKVLCIAAIVGVLAVGCNTSEQGSPTTATSVSGVGPASTTDPQQSSTTSSLPFAGAPKVSTPLDATKFLNDPCLALTSGQVAQLQVGQGKESQGPLGNKCEWVNHESLGYVNVQFLAKFREGLSAVYKANDDGKYAVFEPVADVAGFPAVVAGQQNDQNSGICIMFIGLSDDLAMQLGVRESESKRGTVEPCDVTKAVAPLVLETMKAGA